MHGGGGAALQHGIVTNLGNCSEQEVFKPKTALKKIDLFLSKPTIV
jgi:hypothetical protein